MFWRKSPRQIIAIFEAKQAQLVREHNERAWQVWQAENLRRSKRLPPLKKLQHRVPRDGKPKSWQQMKAQAKLWTLAPVEPAARAAK